MTPRLPCGFRFPEGGTRCLVFADHPIHGGKWTRPEPNHDYEPFERRKAERRSAVTLAAALLEVQFGAEHNAKCFDQGPMDCPAALWATTMADRLTATLRGGTEVPRP